MNDAWEVQMIMQPPSGHDGMWLRGFGVRNILTRQFMDSYNPPVFYWCPPYIPLPEKMPRSGGQLEIKGYA
jgi:hypothetical protein